MVALQYIFKSTTVRVPPLVCKLTITISTLLIKVTVLMGLELKDITASQEHRCIMFTVGADEFGVKGYCDVREVLHESCL